MTTARKFRRICLAGALALSLGACISFGGKAPPSLLVLTAESGVANGVARSASASDALVVLLPEAARKLDNNRVPVQIDDSSIAYLKDAYWADKPARLMQGLLIETIGAKGNKLVLNQVDAGGKAGEFLSGSLIEFGVDAAANEAVVVYDAVRLVRGQSVEKRRFEARSPLAEVEAAAAGVALNRSANQVASQVADWIG